jgi:RNA polymerase sigma-70 factor (ECF subfamily)
MGNRHTFETAARELIPALYRVALRLTRHAADAEDLVSQTLLAAAKGWHTFDGRLPKPWFMRVMRNEHLHCLRHRASRPQTTNIDDTPEASDTTDVWREVDVRLVGERIIEELDKVPDEYRVAVVLCDIEQMTYDEAAKALDVPIGTVRSRLHRGRHLLRQRLAYLL